MTDLVNPQAKKVLIVMSRHGLWGDEINLLRLLPKLDRSKIQPLALLPEGSDLLRERLAEMNIETWQRTMPAWRKPKGWPSMGLYIGEIVWEVYKRGIDVVLGLNVVESPAAVIAGWLSGRPSVVWFHDSIISGKKTRAYLMHRADAIIAISDYMRQRVQQWAPTPAVPVIYNGIDPEQFHPDKSDTSLRAELGIPTDALVLGMVGRLTDIKGQRELLCAAGELKKRGLRPHILLAGEGKADYRQSLEQEIQRFDLAEQIHFLGFREDVASVLAAMDLFVMLSVNEAFSLAMGEAMAMERPCVYAPVGGAKELAGEEEIGIPVSRDNPAGIADAIEKLHRNPELRQEMGQRGRGRIIRHFSLDRQARAFEDFLTGF